MRLFKSHLRRTALAGWAFALWVSPGLADGGKACVTDASVMTSKIQSADLDNRFGPVVAPAQSVKFAYVTQLIDDPFWNEVQKGLRSEAARLHAKIEVTAPTDRLSESEQLTVAKAALASGPDVLLLTGINAKNLKPVIDEANARGIPTISINLKADGVRVHIGTDHVSLGALAAEYLHELFPAGAPVGQLEGEVTSPYRIDRVKGFTESLPIYGNLHLVSSVSADWDDAKAKAATLAMMHAHPEIMGIYANSDLMAIGATQALESLQRSDVAVVGTDGVVIAKSAIQSGKMKGTTAQFPVKEGILAIQTGLRLLDCKPVPQWVVSPQVVMTAKSVGDYASAN